ncbi:MAG: MOSC domain-containing protein [Hyphomicrobiaceae bacterium]
MADDGRPTVIGVQINSAHTFSKLPTQAVRLIENLGIEGDAHAGPTDQHQFNIRRFGIHPNLRQVHVMHAELFDELLEKGHTIRPGDLGENITTRNLDLLNLPSGTRLRLGAQAVIELTGLRNPCRQIDNFQPGLRQHCIENSPEGLVRKAGVMSIVIRGGDVRTGDPIAIELPPIPHAPLRYRNPELDARELSRSAT